MTCLRSWALRPSRNTLTLEVSSSGRDNATSGNEGEFRGDFQGGGSSRSDSIEYLGVIRGDIGRVVRNAFPDTPDMTLLRRLGGKVDDPFMNLFPKGSSSSSDSKSESLSDFGLPPELRSDGIAFKLVIHFFFRGLTFVFYTALSSRVSPFTPTKKAGEKVTTKDGVNGDTSPTTKGGCHLRKTSSGGRPCSQERQIGPLKG